MNRSRLRTGIVAGLLVFLLVLVAAPAQVSAHEKENFVDWSIGFESIRYIGVPNISVNGGAPVDFTARVSTQPTLNLNTGDLLTISYSFVFVEDFGRRADPFWITRLGLDFATLGRWVDGEWLGGRSFRLDTGVTYDVTMVIRAIQPTSRHLHIGTAVSDVGNIPAAPSDDATVAQVRAGTLPGGPVLYGVFTVATGSVVEPLDGINVGGIAEFPDGNFPLLATWPWATVGVIAQILIGLFVIAVMYWYGRRLAGGG